MKVTFRSAAAGPPRSSIRINPIPTSDAISPTAMVMIGRTTASIRSVA